MLVNEVVPFFIKAVFNRPGKLIQPHSSSSLTIMIGICSWWLWKPLLNQAMLETTRLRSLFSHRSLHWSTVNSRLGVGFLNEGWPGDKRNSLVDRALHIDLRKYVQMVGTTTFFPHKMTSRNSECSVLFVGLSVHLFNFCRVFIWRIPAEKKGWQNLRNWDIELNNSSHSSLSSPRDCLLQSAFRFMSQFNPHDSTWLSMPFGMFKSCGINSGQTHQRTWGNFSEPQQSQMASELWKTVPRVLQMCGFYFAFPLQHILQNDLRVDMINKMKHRDKTIWYKGYKGL